MSNQGNFALALKHYSTMFAKLCLVSITLTSVGLAAVPPNDDAAITTLSSSLPDAEVRSTDTITQSMGGMTLQTGRRIVRPSAAFRNIPVAVGTSASAAMAAQPASSPREPFARIASSIDETMTIMVAEIGRDPAAMEYVALVDSAVGAGVIPRDARRTWAKLAFLSFFIQRCRVNPMQMVPVIRAITRHTCVDGDALIPRIFSAVAELRGDYGDPSFLITGLYELARSRLVNEVLAPLERCRVIPDDRSCYRNAHARLQEILDPPSLSTINSALSAAIAGLATGSAISISLVPVVPSTIVPPVFIDGPEASRDLPGAIEVSAIADMMTVAEPIYGDSSLPVALSEIAWSSSVEAVVATPV